MYCNSFNVIYVLFAQVLWKNILKKWVQKNRIKREGQSIQTVHKTARALKIKSLGTYANFSKRHFETIPVSLDKVPNRI